MINALIIDDEPLAREILESHLKNVPEIQLIDQCDNAVAARKVIQKTDIDLIFLDIQMPQMSGIELVRSMSHPPAIIFTTAYDNYAVEGFELNAVDYLLKPISLERFLKATDKAVEQIIANHKDRAEEIDAEDDYIFVKSDKKLIKINYSNVLYIEGLKDYVIIKLKDKRVITLQTMKSMEEKLPDTIFMRIHRSYLVNLSQVESISGNMVEIREKDQLKKLPVGKSYRDQLLAVIDHKRL